MARYPIVGVCVLLSLLCAATIAAQGAAPASVGNVATSPRSSGCFASPGASKEALRKLPAAARYWLAEDAIYIISPEERCTFLHLATDVDREHFVEQFWFRRASDPSVSVDDFKIEHYRRFVFANQKFVEGIEGWKTDRGRMYIILGPPDSREFHAVGEKTGNRVGDAAYLHRTEVWHYNAAQGLRDAIDLQFEDSSWGGNFGVTNRDALNQVAAWWEKETWNRARRNLPDSTHPGDPQQPTIYLGPQPVPRIRFPDLEALVTSHLVRDQVAFSPRFEFAAATHATTLASIIVDIPTEQFRSGQSSQPLSTHFEVFIRVSMPSGRVMDTAEVMLGEFTRDGSLASPFVGRVDTALPPGKYELATVVKNAGTDEVGASRTKFDVPTYEALQLR